MVEVAWQRNVHNPTTYRMELAVKFSREMREKLGGKWHGIYVIGSTASSMASHLKDVDVFPLIDGELAKEDVKKMREGVDHLERSTGVFVEVFLNRGIYSGIDADKPKLANLQTIRTHGIETFVESEAVLVDSDLGSMLLERVVRPDFAARYAEAEYAELRGEDSEAEERRVIFDFEQSRKRAEIIGIVTEWRAKGAFAGFGDAEETAFAQLLLLNLIPMRYDIYNRFEHLVRRDPRLMEFLGRAPDKKYMMAKLPDVQKVLKDRSESAYKFRERLAELDSELTGRGFVGIPEFWFTAHLTVKEQLELYRSQRQVADRTAG